MTITNTKYKGRDFTLQIETATPGTYETIGGVRAKSFSLNQEEIDITDGDDDPWKKLLEGGVRSLAVSGSGFVTNHAGYERLQSKAFGGNIWKFKLNFGDSDSVLGSFQITSFENNGEYNGAQQFSVSLSSADTPTLTEA